MSSVISGIGFGLVTASVIALGAVGFSIQFGVSNIFNIAYAQVMIAAAFVAYLVNVDLGLSIWIALPVAGVAGAALSAAMYFGVYAPYQRRGASVFTVVMVSLALLLILQYGLQLIFGTNYFTLNLGVRHSFRIGDIIWTSTQVILMVITAASVLVLYLGLTFTRLGKAMRATAGDPDLARYSGIDVRKVIGAAWLLSGFLCGLAGAEFVMQTAVFTTATGGTFLLLVFAAAVVGGVGEIYGPLVGAVLIGVATELTAIVLPDIKDVAGFALLVIMLLVRPRGLFGAPAAEGAGGVSAR